MRRTIDVCQRNCTNVYIIWSLVLSSNNFLALWPEKKKKENIGRLKFWQIQNVLEAIVSSSQLKKVISLFIPEDLYFFSKIRQIKAYGITFPTPWRNLDSVLCAGALYSFGLQRQPNFQTFHRTFSLSMLLMHVPCQREQKSKSRELTWHLTHYQCLKST